MEQVGTDFIKTVEGYETVAAVVTNGNDIAEYNDVGAAEQLNGSGANASIPARGTNVNGFDRVRATSRTGETATSDIDVVNYIFEQIGQWNDI